jgi:hypothetical protein
MVSGIGGKIVEAIVLESILGRYNKKKPTRTQTSTRGKGRGRGRGKTTTSTRGKGKTTTTRGRKPNPKVQTKNPKIEDTKFVPDTSIANNSKFCKSCGNSGSCCYCR